MEIAPEILLGPGVYDDLPNDIYHGDCCEGPSISSSGLRVVRKDPAKFWDGCAMNPEVKARKEKEREDARSKGIVIPKRHFDRGSAAHVLTLEPEKITESVSVVPADLLGANGSLSTKAAKAFVAEQQALGRAVLKPEEWDMVCDMADALQSNAQAMDLMDGCTIEQSHIWKDTQTGMFIKSRPDMTPTEAHRWIVDYKTTDHEDIDVWVKKSLVDTRLDIQAALQMWGVYEATGYSIPGVAYLVQNTKTKRVAVRYLSKGSDLLAAARQDLRDGLNAFARCWEDGHWPSPWDRIEEMVPPGFREREIEKQLSERAAIFPGEFAA
ncbi:MULTISPECIES: PD-(D/E)XK nuclease-like domain-containing protein [unclassified Mameliella]|uniref:PD-(D/E)XK nuclease-like domain-containing protein n=1 Tax=Mameliella sp. LZ-28 TaxID=2484146 RepID=UPI00143F2E16|nr:PD-(D/E)XK nuclease-like domain-containing protein [Mameliella sp. LZ-28]MCR9276214.1 PD-(D/E)XK nuclease-like domain-containing protein [Paracoccaceae bacterium]